MTAAAASVLDAAPVFADLVGQHEAVAVLGPAVRAAAAIVRGEPALWAYHDPRPCLVPPDWSGGYTSLFALQQKEKWEDVQPSP